MSEPAATGAAQATETGPSAGTLLRQAREGAGLHIAALAVSLKVPVKKLEALEADQVDLLPDAVFARALASSVCRTLKVDPAPILARLPQNVAPRLAREDAAINAPFRSPGDGPGPTLWDQLSRPVVLAVLAFLLGALVLIFLPSTPRESSTVASVSPSPAAAPAVEQRGELAAVGAATLTPTPGLGTAVATGALPAPATTQPATGTAASLSMSVALSAPAPPAPPVAAASVPAAVVAAGKAIVTFTSRSESWVEVTDATGTVALRKLLSPGESVGASGALPLAVVVGRADATDVLVRGKAFDLAPLSRDNVARFEVK
jgi:cytoskeleton protein RodZ